MKGNYHFNNEFFGANSSREIKEVESTAPLVVAPSAVKEPTSTLAEGVRHVETNDTAMDPNTGIAQTTLALSDNIAEKPLVEPALSKEIIIEQNNYIPTGGFAVGAGQPTELVKNKAIKPTFPAPQKNFALFFIVIGTVALIAGARINAKTVAA